MEIGEKLLRMHEKWRVQVYPRLVAQLFLVWNGYFGFRFEETKHELVGMAIKCHNPHLGLHARNWGETPLAAARRIVASNAR